MSRDGYLPDGVENWMIPGNRPEEEAFGRAYERLDETTVKDLRVALANEFERVLREGAKDEVSLLSESEVHLRDAWAAILMSIGLVDDGASEGLAHKGTVSEEYDRWLRAELEGYDAGERDEDDYVQEWDR